MKAKRLLSLTRADRKIAANARAANVQYVVSPVCRGQARTVVGNKERDPMRGNAHSGPSGVDMMQMDRSDGEQDQASRVGREKSTGKPQELGERLVSSKVQSLASKVVQEKGDSGVFTQTE